MKIKTIIGTEPADFDPKVNAALDEGYQLIRRDVVRIADNNSRLYAELILPDAPAEPDLDAAMDLIKEECNRHLSCCECPLQDRCDCEPPSVWDVPEESRGRQ